MIRSNNNNNNNNNNNDHRHQQKLQDPEITMAEHQQHQHQYQQHQHIALFKNYPLTRVTACVGWAVHGFVLEFANGCRTGRLLSNNQREMGLGDTAIASRRIPPNKNNDKNWVKIDPGDEIIRVSGFNLTHRNYLCHSILLHLRSGKCIRFASRFEGWRGTEFGFEVPSLRQQGILREIQFERGHVLGLDFVETTLHLPVRKELVPTYPIELQRLIRKMVGEEAPGRIPEDVWFTRIFPTLLGAELMEKINDELATILLTTSNRGPPPPPEATSQPPE